MGRAGRILLVLAVVLAGLLAVNFFVLNDETKPAEVTAEGGEVLELQSVDLQVFDSPATGERAGGPADRAPARLRRLLAVVGRADAAAQRAPPDHPRST